MNGQLEKHLQNIEDFIQIDDKIVTYKWISKVLKVHTNTAKQLLFAFTKKPGVSEKLLVTYVVAGEHQDGGGLSYRLVQEKDLEDTKKTFHKITSTHVYCIQRGTAVSGADIYNADSSYKLTFEDNKFCSIQPEGEIERREMKVVIPPKTQQAASSIPNKAVPKKATPSVSQDLKSSTRKSPERLKTKDVPPNREEPEEKRSPIKSCPKKNDKKPVPAKSGNIGALFIKQAAKNKDNSAAKVKEEVKGNDVKVTEILSEKPSEKEVKTPTANKLASKKKRKKPKDSKDSAVKRRKRIQVASDSESSDQESDGNERFPSPEPEPDTPMVVESEEEEIIPATPLEKSKQRVRKLVDRTFEDEEGYIITKKEFVFESVSDDEHGDGEPAVKKAEVETTAEKTKPNEKSLADTPKAKSKQESPSSKPRKKQQDAGSKGGNKPGRPASKAKINHGTNSPKKQASITNFFKKQ